MLIRHATPVRNLRSIRSHGLLAARALGKRPAVWLHTAERSAWAALHTVRRHRCRAEAVAILILDLPRSWLTRSRRGLWYSLRDVPPARIVGHVTFAALSRSPLED